MFLKHSVPHNDRVTLLNIFLLIVLVTALVYEVYLYSFIYVSLTTDLYTIPSLNISNISHKSMLTSSVFKKELLKRIYGSPYFITIPSLSIKSFIVPVGYIGNRLDVPKSWFDVGWYKNGSLPGQPGTLLLNGHYDTNSGTPGVFWRLKNIRVGDKVIVTDIYGRRFTYIVINKKFTDVNDSRFLPKQSNKPALVLITCDGVWLSNKGTYNKRLLVNAILAE